MEKPARWKSFLSQLNWLRNLAAILCISLAPFTVLGQQESDLVDRARAQAREKIRQDNNLYSQEDLQEIARLYSLARDRSAAAYQDAKAALETLYQMYPKSNRVGCALVFVQMNDASPINEQIFLLQKAIDEYSDGFFENGVQVGALARVRLAGILDRQGEHQKAENLRRDVRENFPDAVDHAGKRFVSSFKGNQGVILADTGNQVDLPTGFIWDKFRQWQALPNESQEAKTILAELVSDVYVVTFGPAEGFTPLVARDYFDKINARSDRNRLGTVGFFKVRRVDDQLIASFLTENPDTLEKEIENNPLLRLISTEAITPDKFIEYINIVNESIPPPKNLSIPPPERGRMSLDRLLVSLHDYDGKVVETTINRVSTIEQIDEAWTRTSASFTDGGSYSFANILCPSEGVEFFQIVRKTSSPRTVFLRVCRTSPIRINNLSFTLEAVGTRYNRSRDEYSW